MSSRAICLIPVFNNASTVGEVVRKCRDQGFPVVVVNDGSTDGSAEAARNAGAIVVSFSKNRGKGAALRAGFSYVLREYPDAEFVVTLDADGQHDPADIPRLLAAAEGGNTLVIGSRTLERFAMPLLRRIANRVISSLISSLLGSPISDTQSGLRAIPMRLIREKKFSQARYGIETEMLFAAKAAGLAVREVPIKAVYFRNAPLSVRKDLVNLCDILGIAFLKGALAACRSRIAWREVLVAAILAGALAWQFDVAIAPLGRALEQGRVIFSKLTADTDVQEKLAVFEWLRLNTPQDAIVFAPRGEGHRIMGLADRRAVVSSKVYPSESADVARRMRDTARFFFATDTHEALRILRSYAASYVLVPKSRDWFGMCRDIAVCHWVTVHRNDAARSFSAGDLTPEGNQRTLVGKLLGKAEIPFLRNVWDSPSYLVYRVVDSSEPAPCELTFREQQAIVNMVYGASATDEAVFSKQCDIVIELWQAGVRRYTGTAKGLKLGMGIQKALADYLGDVRAIEAMKITVSDPLFPAFSNDSFVAVGGVVQTAESAPWSEEELRLRVKSALDWILQLQQPDGTFRNFIDPEHPDAKDPEPRDIALDALGAWTLAEGYAEFHDARYLSAALAGLSRVEKEFASGNPVRTNALSFALMARIRMWEATSDAQHVHLARLHADRLRSLLSHAGWFPERFRLLSDDAKAADRQYSSIATHIAFWALSTYYDAANIVIPQELVLLAETLQERFLTNRIVKRDLDLAESARLANGFRAFVDASGDMRFANVAFQIGKWLSEYQYVNHPPDRDGAFPETPQTSSIDTNSVGRVAEGLVFAGLELRDAARGALRWLMQMQYTPDSLPFVPAEMRASLVGGLRASPSRSVAPIGAASHFVLAALWYLAR